MKIGEAIRILRVRRHLSQAVLAGRSGISVSYLSLLESGKRQPPLETIATIAKALGLPAAMLHLLAIDKEQRSELPESVQAKLSEALGLLLQELDDDQG